VTKNGSRNQDNPHLIYEAELCDLLWDKFVTPLYLKILLHNAIRL
jgi:hypothetical protein